MHVILYFQLIILLLRIYREKWWLKASRKAVYMLWNNLEILLSLLFPSLIFHILFGIIIWVMQTLEFYNFCKIKNSLVFQIGKNKEPFVLFVKWEKVRNFLLIHPWVFINILLKNYTVTYGVQPLFLLIKNLNIMQS